MQILQFLGAFTIGAAIVAFVVKLLIEYSLKATMNLQSHHLDKTLESHKTELKNFENQFQNTLDVLLHKTNRVTETRLSIISETYKKLVRFEDELIFLTRTLKPYVEDEDKRAEISNKELVKASECFNEFSIYYRENKIFLSEEIAKNLDSLLALFYETLFDHEMSKADWARGTLAWDLYKKNRERMKSDIPKSKAEIEKLFRKIIE